MAMIKIQGSTKLQGKTIFDTGFKATDTDAAAYIAAVESADGDTLEDGVKEAYENFIVGCKSDSIWSSLKASCIMAGARTLNGALVPLVGTAPTNNNFVSADYNRETGLVGDASTKYLLSNRANNADPEGSKHISFYATALSNVNYSNYMGQITSGNAPGFWVYGGVRAYPVSTTYGALSHTIGFFGISKNSTTSYTRRSANTTSSGSNSSETSNNTNIAVYAASSNLNRKINGRLSFYSIGEATDLAALDTRVSTLMTDLAAAI